jgi:hypothetical protein
MGGTRFPGGYVPYPLLTVSGSKVWAPCPHPPPRESHDRGRKRARAPPGTFSETPDVGRMLLATCHKTNSQHWSQHLSSDVARTTVRNMGQCLSQHRKSFSQHPLRAAPRSTADRPLHPNRAAQHPSDASARIVRPGASSTTGLKALLHLMLSFHQLSACHRAQRKTIG